jgi:MATE family multidrug resistance protein
MMGLALPVIVARAGLVVMLTVDTLMTGLAGAGEIAYLALGLSPVMVFMLATVGLLQGAMVMVAQANGAGDHQRCGAIWRVAMVHAAVLGSLFALVGFFAEDLFLAIGHDPELARGAAAITIAFAWGMPGMLLYIACGYLMEGIGRPRAGMIILLGANVVNVFADGIFAAGWWGLVEPMGASGAVMTTSVIRWGLLFAILPVILSMRDREKFGLTKLSTPFWPIARGIWRLGWPVSATGAMENGSYAVLAQMAAFLGAPALAAHQVTMNMLILAYMGANGMAAAASVRVGNAVGQGNHAAIRLRGWTGIVLGAGLMSLAAALFVIAPGVVADLFLHTDAKAHDVALGSLTAAGVFIVFAGAMSVTMGALRGAGDTLSSMGAYGLGFVTIGVPAGWLFGFPLGLGAPGLIYGLLTGLLAALALVLWRFSVVAARGVRPV